MTSLTPDEGPAWQAVRLSTGWERTRRRIEAGQQLRIAEGRLLWLLRDGHARTLREIAEALDLEQSTVNRQVHAALDSGVVTRARVGGAYVVEMSELGRGRFSADLARLLSIYGAAVEAVPEGEREAFIGHLGAFVSAMSDAAETPISGSLRS